VGGERGKPTIKKTWRKRKRGGTSTGKTIGYYAKRGSMIPPGGFFVAKKWREGLRRKLEGKKNYQTASVNEGRGRTIWEKGLRKEKT